MNRKFEVCFVCTGNACRSPFAESVLRTLLNKEGLIGIDVLSCGTVDWGKNPRDTTMIQVAREMGYELKGTTTPMTYEMLKDVDVIIAFDISHYNSITRILDYCNWNRIKLFNKISYNIDTEVMDPHGLNITSYRQIAGHIEEGCKNLIKQWKEFSPVSDF